MISICSRPKVCSYYRRACGILRLPLCQMLFTLSLLLFSAPLPGSFGFPTSTHEKGLVLFPRLTTHLSLPKLVFRSLIPSFEWIKLRLPAVTFPTLTWQLNPSQEFLPENTKAQQVKRSFSSNQERVDSQFTINEISPLLGENVFDNRRNIESIEVAGFPYLNPQLSNKNTELSFQTPVFGSIHKFAYYFLDIIVGSDERQRQSLIVDTGSSVVAFACGSCDACGSHIDKPFHCAKSSTCTAVACYQDCFSCQFQDKCFHCVSQCSLCTNSRRCAYNVNYAEGSSIAGRWNMDIVKFPLARNGFEEGTWSHSLPVSIPFGCHDKETNLFLSQAASGIIGLQLESSYGPKTFLQSSFHGHNLNKIFSLCLAEEGGVFSLGRANAEFHFRNDKMPSIPIAWLQLFRYTNVYYVELISMNIGGSSIPVSQSPYSTSQLLEKSVLSSLDSGTTLTYFPPKVYKAVINTIESYLVQNGFQYRENYDSRRGTRNLGDIIEEYNEMAKVPTAPSAVSLGDAANLPVSAHPRHAQMVYPQQNSKCWYLPRGELDLELFPKVYLNFKSSSPSQSAVAEVVWYPSSYLYSRGSSTIRCLSIEEGNSIILGMTVFIGHDVIFDLEKEKIGFAAAQCPRYSINDRYSS
ncbi:eukaryotic aspartyl protease superfamily protein [Cardiosporidium cionae]|uniref:Eukaryotic aspartyl protease superfamily protein n=1 Tax=Cardiosporidium cionae TaxID=476202 RepID=A0ABQ7JCW7_9APIC|nr:eukaryotic aspartyl protease superfamily protein [Cardiosporidium cionae]|eukprot:KAF8821886.1 eukaryotic aspartyl protease superfamily protein [Cardiosporidium cionae]